jgi:hypothetical protein
MVGAAQFTAQASSYRSTAIDSAVPRQPGSDGSLGTTLFTSGVQLEMDGFLTKSTCTSANAIRNRSVRYRQESRQRFVDVGIHFGLFVKENREHHKDGPRHHRGQQPELFPLEHRFSNKRRINALGHLH